MSGLSESYMGKIMATIVATAVALVSIGFGYVEPIRAYVARVDEEQQAHIDRVENRLDELLERTTRVETKLDLIIEENGQ